VLTLGGDGLSYSELKSICLNKLDTLLLIPGALNTLPHLNTQTKGSLLLVIKKELNLPSNEGYILLVKNKKVTIEAKNRNGLFYGMHTIKMYLFLPVVSQIIPASL
jgi:hypothetical protein